MGVGLAALNAIFDPVSAFADPLAGIENSEGETFANGNLVIPKATRNIRIYYATSQTTLDVILKELFTQVKVKCVLAPQTTRFASAFGTSGGPFEAALWTALTPYWDCRIVNGVYYVFPVRNVGIVQGRPDLDTRWLTREFHGWSPVRPFFEGFFAEAGLRHQVSDDCPDQIPGMKIKCHFREALKAALWEKLTFHVRDGVYCIEPRPDL